MADAGPGPVWDHTLRTMLNDTRVRQRQASRPGREDSQRPGVTSYRYFLGVKWSQVQILAARRRSAYGSKAGRTVPESRISQMLFLVTPSKLILFNVSLE